MKVVHVQWVDPAYTENEWQQWSEVNDWIKEGAAQCESVGLLIHEDDSLIVLAQSVGEDQIIAGGLKITREAIKKIKELGEIDITLKEFG